MRKIIFAICVLSFLAGCRKDDAPVNQSAGESETKGSICFYLDGYSVDDTKASAVENQMNDIQMLLFNNENTGLKLYRYHRFTDQQRADGKVVFDDIRAAAYRICIIANGPDLSAVKSYGELNSGTDMTTVLDTYNKTGWGYQMYGCKDTVIAAGTTPMNIPIVANRMVARVSVSSITNALPSLLGDIKVSSIMLTNVYGRYKLTGGKPQSEVWYNQEGRKDETPRIEGHIIDGSTYASSCPDLLFRAFSSRTVANGATDTGVSYLYAYPNDATAVPDGFRNPFNPQKTCMVLTAVVNGKTSYYPVVLDKLESNRTYDIKLTIQGVGSDDPNEPINPGSLAASISVLDWKTEKKYTDKI